MEGDEIPGISGISGMDEVVSCVSLREAAVDDFTPSAESREETKTMTAAGTA